MKVISGGRPLLPLRLLPVMPLFRTEFTQMALTNDELASSIRMLNKIKEKTGASYVRVSTTPFDGITIQIDWDDDCHTRKNFTDSELLQAEFDILSVVVEYANQAHKMLLEGKL